MTGEAIENIRPSSTASQATSLCFEQTLRDGFAAGCEARLCLAVICGIDWGCAPGPGSARSEAKQ